MSHPRRISGYLLILLVVSCCIEESFCYPGWFEQLLNPYYQQPYGKSYYPSNRQLNSRQLGGKERYKANCRVINPDNYAFPGAIPYPSAPFCPY